MVLYQANLISKLIGTTYGLKKKCLDLMKNLKLNLQNDVDIILERDSKQEFILRNLSSNCDRSLRITYTILWPFVD